MKKAIKLKPDLIIINSPELLIYALIYKLITNKPLVYDIRENYFKNLFYQKNYHFFLKYYLAFSVRMLEIITSPFIDFFFLAEKSYEKELFFVRKKSSVIENKFLPKNNYKQPPKQKNQTLNFVYTGTVSRTYGTIEAILFVEKLHAINPTITLTIIGYCSDKKYFNEIIQITKDQKFIKIKIQKNPIPHHFILEEILKADFGILSYPKNKSTENCIPTKIYEFLALQTPMVIPKNPLWESLILPYQAGISVHFEKMNPKEILEKISHECFFSKAVPDIFWKFNEDKLHHHIKEILREK